MTDKTASDELVAQLRALAGNENWWHSTVAGSRQMIASVRVAADALESNPRHAQILIGSTVTDCVFYGISLAELWPLRGAIDAARAAEEPKQ